jgi:hypothetical protein
MSTCRRIENCSFFNIKMKAMPITAKFFMKNYCEGDHSKCARNYLFTYMEKNDFSTDDKTKDIIAKLSDTLYPDQLEIVKKALPDSGSK